MAKAFLLALGSRGDVQPFVALAVGLHDAGHDVVLATPTGFDKLISGRGFTHVEVANPPESLTSDPDQDLFKTAQRHPIREVRRLLAIWYAQMDDAMAAIPTASEGVDIVLWWEPMSNFCRHLAEALGVPGVAGGLNPENWPSSTIPEPAIPPPPGWLTPAWRARYNRLGHEVFVQTTASLYRSRVNRWRRDVLGLPELPRWARASEKIAAPVLRLSEASPLVRPMPPEWQGSVITTGYWQLPRDKDWVMPAKLRVFLDNGPPPVFASMGTAVSFPPQIGPMVVEAARRAGVRLVLGSGWDGKGGLDASDLPPDMIAIGDVPHERIFPSMAGVVHHGGGGSTAAALRSGVPSVALPVFGDQPYWGRRISELGVGPEPIPAKKVTVDRLVAAMRHLIDDESMRARAVELAARLREEDGVTTAVRAIEALLPDELVPSRAEPDRLSLI